MVDVSFFKPAFTEADARAVYEQVESDWIGPGEAGKRLAEHIATKTGVEYCLLTNSGTMALTLATHHMGPRHEVLVPAYGIASTINGLILSGLKPRLVDIDPRAGTITADLVRERMTSVTRAVCFVDFSGYVGPELVKVAELCRDEGLVLIEDAACAYGNSYGGTSAGAFGDVGTFSFSVVKPITTGQGGAVVTSDPEIFERALALSDHGGGDWRRTHTHLGVGGNFRMTDIQAALAISQLTRFADTQDMRRERYDALKDSLNGALFDVPGDNLSLYHIVFSPERDELIDTLGSAGITAKSPYKSLTHHLSYVQLADAPFPGADWWMEHAVYLPFGPGQTLNDMDTVGRVVAESNVELIKPL